MSGRLAPGSSVLVVGGGVVGAATAFALGRAGFEVTLVTAQDVGDGATSGNAGLLVPADSVVWAGPDNLRVVPAAIVGHGSSSIRVAGRGLATVSWGLRFLASSTARRYEAACRAAHALSRHSLSVLDSWADDLGADMRHTGMVFLVDSPDAARALVTARAPLVADGETYAEMTRAEVSTLDPAYASLPTGLRAVYARGAAQCDSRALTRKLTDGVRASGGSVWEREPVRELLTQEGRVVGARTDRRRLRADAVVVAAGTGTRALTGAMGVRASILPVQGYAATVPIRHPDKAPQIGGVLEPRHVAYSRMDGALRLTTGAEIGRADHIVPPATTAHLRAAAEELFPGALDWSGAAYGAEHRPMTPTGLPLLGPAVRRPGLYLNAGHGSLGLTQAAGSADVLASIMTGAGPAIDPAPFQPR